MTYFNDDDMKDPNDETNSLGDDDMDGDTDTDDDDDDSDDDE